MNVYQLTFDISDAEINLLKELCQALSPLKAAIETLGAEKADLLVAEKVFAFVIKKLSQLKTNIGKNLKERFFVRVKERRNHGLVHLFEYLKRPIFTDDDIDQFGVAIKPSNIVSLANNLANKYFVTCDSSNEQIQTSSSVIDELSEQQDSDCIVSSSIREELASFIEDAEKEAQGSWFPETLGT